MSAGPAPRTQALCALSLTTEETGSTLHVRIGGDFDLAAIGQVMGALDRIDPGRTSLLVFDLQRVDFLDMAGLRTILRAADYCREHEIDVRVIKPRGLASRVFTLTRVHRELDLVDAPVPAHAVSPPPTSGPNGTARSR